ncbi:MAG: ExbD/TolR family protein [Prevotella sp.]
MLKRRCRHRQKVVNTTSTADISFILLVFFLVITSIDTDKGLLRQMPPLDDRENPEMIEVNNNNLLRVNINSSGALMIDGSLAESSSLKDRVIRFVGKESDRQRHVIILEVDRNAEYEMYFKVLNEIMSAYMSLRNTYAHRYYGRDYERCSAEQREAVRAYYPQRITETFYGKEKGGLQ